MDRLLTLTFNTNEFCHCGHRESEHHLDAVLLCAGETGCVCELFEAEQMPMEKALPILVDYAGSCRRDSVSLAIMAILRDHGRLHEGLRNIQAFGAQAQANIARNAIAGDFEEMMVKEFGVTFVDVTPPPEYEVIEVPHYGKVNDREVPNG